MPSSFKKKTVEKLSTKKLKGGLKEPSKYDDFNTKKEPSNLCKSN